MLHLVTDSTAYLTPEQCRRWNLHTVPLTLHLPGYSVSEEQVDLPAFFRLMADVKTAPTTSQPTPESFVELYRRLTRRPEDEVLSVHLSGELSGTSEGARWAAGQVDPQRITVIDSRLVTGAQAVVVLAAAEAIVAGKGRAEVASMVERMGREFFILLTVDDLGYLHKGGRINSAERWVGTIFCIKPVLGICSGRIEPVKRVRTRERALQYILDEVCEHLGRQRVRAGVTHVGVPEQAAALAQLAQARLNCHTFLFHETGPVIAAHAGPGLLGLGGCPVDEDGF